MRYIRQHIENIITQYDGSMPLAHFLRSYFKQFPKLGSRDRKMLSEMSYSWYRCSKGFPKHLAFDDKLNACLYLCETSVPHIISLLPEALQNKQSLSVSDRIRFLKGIDISFDISALVSFAPVLSAGIKNDDWLGSMRIQPRLFIRIVKDKEKVIAVLNKHGVAFKEHDIIHKEDDNSSAHIQCLSFANSTPIDKILSPDSYVVQDLSSQKTGQFFHPSPKEHWLDCCAGAGGKSLLLKQIEPKINLSVSDTRPSIIHNLMERFKQYRIDLPASFIADARDINELKNAIGNKQFDAIICDVPCTGSGTWARTPEQLYFFKQEQIGDYAERQKQIVSNAIEFLKPGGRLIYITCSVFAAENEDVINFLAQKNNVTVREKQLINGIAWSADSMFVALMQKTD